MRRVWNILTCFHTLGFQGKDLFIDLEAKASIAWKMSYRSERSHGQHWRERALGMWNEQQGEEYIG
jgi:hypothetical protein